VLPVVVFEGAAEVLATDVRVPRTVLDGVLVVLAVAVAFTEALFNTVGLGLLLPVTDPVLDTMMVGLVEAVVDGEAVPV
jgi:hypothetical protein